MNWHVTYRAKDGKQAVGVFEADSRETLLKVLLSKGITAIRVADGFSQQKHPRILGRKLRFHRAMIWTCVGLVVVASAFFMATYLGIENGARQIPVDSDKDQRIVEIAPSFASPSPTVQPKMEKSVRRMSAKGTSIPDNVQPDERGVLRYPGGLRWVDTNDINMVRHPRKKQLFKHHSENSIATLLTLEPEKMAPFLVGRRPKFGQRFVDDFKASFYDEPTFPNDDTPEEREIRNMVLDVKKELKEALDRGENIAQMMNDAQNELDRLVSYRDTLTKQLKEIKLDGQYSDDDVHDFITAANQMLKSRGLQELATPNLTYRQFMLQRRRERAQSQQSESERNDE